MNIQLHRRLVATALALVAVLGACSGGPEAEWCGVFEDAATASQAYRQADDADKQEAVNRLDEAMETFRTSTPPEEIKADFETMMLGQFIVEPTEYQAASERLQTWIVENCDLSDELTEYMFPDEG